MVRYTPNGTVDIVVRLPVTYPTCVCLGGRDLDTLFVTSASYPLAAVCIWLSWHTQHLEERRIVLLMHRDRGSRSRGSRRERA